MSSDTAVDDDEAVAAGLTDTIEPEPEVVEVDTSGPIIEPGDTEIPDGAEIHHLPVRHQAQHGTLDTMIPLQEEMRGLAQMAVTLATSNLVPKALREKPADVLAILLTGRELGVASMTALRTFHVINGTVTLAPKVRMAMVNRQGLGDVYPHQPPRDVACPRLTEGRKHNANCAVCAGAGTVTKLCPCGSPSFEGTETDADCATWHAERKDRRGIIYTATYTTAMAGAVSYDEWVNNVKVKKKLGDKDNWKNYPAQMCQWRALGYVLDQAFPEVGTGLYSADEIGAVTDEDGMPILDVDSTEVLVPSDTSKAGQARQRQAEQQRARAANAGQPSAQDAPASPDTLATFKTRIEKIKLYTGAPDALKALWQADDGNGQPKLPPVDHLLYRHCKMAAAMLDTIEKRIAKGDFGEEIVDAVVVEDQADAGDAPDPEPQAQTVEPDAPEASDGDTPTELWFDPAELPQGRTPGDDLAWVEKASEELVAEIAAAVTDIPTDQLTAVLKALDLSSNGLGEAQRRARVTARRVRLHLERLAGVK